MGDRDPSTHVTNSTDAATDPHLTESTIDLHGLTLLATGGPRPALDVIFVHGLQGHPEKTWTYTSKTRSKDSKRQAKASKSKFWRSAVKTTSSAGGASTLAQNDSPVYWPTRLLAHDLPNARVFTYGYDSQISHFFSGSANQNTITENGRALLNSIASKRQDCQGRPLMLVVHSLGGIVVKSALRISALAEDPSADLRDVYQSTFAILFFGTPHRGSEWTNAGQIATKFASALGFSSTQYNLQALQGNTEILEILRDEFIRMLDKEGFEITSFQESYGFKGVKGLDAKIVGPDSSGLDHRCERKVPINGNHFDICKFPAQGSERKEYDEKVRYAFLRHWRRESKRKEEQQRETNIHAPTQNTSVSLGPSETKAYYACLSALCLTNPRDDRKKLKTTKGSRVDGTCEWIKDHPPYKSWVGSQSQLLWLSGGPGKGKTMLSIFLAEELEGIARPSQNELFPQDKLFLQYFCDNKDEKRNTAVAVLRGLIYQLLRSCPKLSDHILPNFKIHEKSLFLSTSFETLWSIFETMVCDPALETTYCVLDGLDECDEALLEVLLRKFAALLPAEPNESSACHLNLLIVSRDLPDCIPELLSSFPHISLDPDADTEINKDIDLFIKAKVKELSRRGQYPEKLRVHVEKVFRDRAHGTFLWVGIVAQALGKYKKTEVEQALGLFPPGLDELYARILLQIDHNRREIAAKILRWVVMAVHPLTLSELSVAMENTAEPSFFTPDQLIRDQVSYCGYFLVIKENEVGLIHQSAKDYLLRKTGDSNPELEVFRVKEEVANHEIARRCLGYLESGVLENREWEPDWLLRNPDHLRDFPLLSYAALHWHEHARSLAGSEDIFDLSLPFYHKTSAIRTSWLKAYWLREEHEKPPESFTLLHLASYLGILPLAEKLVLMEGGTNKSEHSCCLKKVDGGGKTALMWAAWRDHEAVVRLLLEKGADIRAQDKYGETALMMAAWSGHEAVVQLLLEKGADIRAQNKYGETALMWAARSGHEAAVRLLLEKGADIRAQDKDGETALVIAAYGGYDAVIRLLLEKGADIEAQDKYGTTALMKAAQYGHWAVVQLLLEKRADISAKKKNGETALMIAAKYGKVAVIQLLLAKGADTKVKNKEGETALMKAVRNQKKCVPWKKSNYKAIIRLLTPNLNS